MVQKILCPINLGKNGRGIARFAGKLARSVGAELVLHHNIDAAPPSPLAVSWMWSEDHERGAEDEVAEAAAVLESLFEELADLQVEGKLTRGPLDAAIHAVAKEAEADLIVIRARSRSAPAHDSETQQIVLHAPCSVLAFGRESRRMPLAVDLEPDGNLPVVVPTDFDSKSDRAVAYALGLAQRLPLRLHLVHALRGEHTPASDAVQAQAEERLRERLPRDLPKHATCRAFHGRPATVIVDHVRRTGARFVIMTAHRKGRLRRAIFGTTTLEVLAESPVPVWFVPQGASASERFTELLEAAVE